MTDEQNMRYREILIGPVKECADYTPKFGHGRGDGFSLEEFRSLYGSDTFYKWLGLDNPLMYSAHKAAGGITSIYRQIGTGCERLVRRIFMDFLGLGADDVVWSYKIHDTSGKERKLSLDGRIIFDKISNGDVKERCMSWAANIADKLELAEPIRTAMSGVVFEVRQGYKSKDSKRQNADIANATNAYINGYIPCLMVMSAQIDDDIVARYNAAKWAILQGQVGVSPTDSTFGFLEQVVGFDLSRFMNENSYYFGSTIRLVLERLMRAE